MKKIEVVHNPSEQTLEEMGVRSWPIWTCEPSKFDWHYDEREICYLLEGQVKVSYEGGEVEFAASDLVTFPAGLSCTWEVTKAVKKHYQLG